VAAAAASAGLSFVVFTDHGDGTRRPDPPVYRSGVLCLDAVEVSTTGGHLVALGLGEVPYPLGGEPRDVVEDVHRFGGFGIVAHPDSPKAELAWHDWTLPVDGVELLNADTAWRKRFYRRDASAWWMLAQSLVSYPVRPPQTIARLFSDAPALMDTWTTLTATRPVVALAGMDAHARLDLTSSDQNERGYSLPIPSYDASFQVMTLHLTPSAPLTGDASHDAALLLEAIEQGRSYTAIDAWAAPARFTFVATRDGRQIEQGSRMASGTPFTLTVRHNAPASFTTRVLRDNTVIGEGHEETLEIAAAGEPGRYRVEIRDPARHDAPPWIISNPIYVVAPHVDATAAAPPASRVVDAIPLFDGRTTDGWIPESDKSSLSAIDRVSLLDGPSLRLRFGLSGGKDIGQFASAAVDTPPSVANYDHIAFSVHAEQPMRLAVQVRAVFPDAHTERWRRSVFVDATDREYVIPFDDMRPVGVTTTGSVPVSALHNVLFVVDTTNTATRTSGQVWLRNVRLEKRAAR
jgi:hypothetical protein